MITCSYIAPRSRESLLASASGDLREQVLSCVRIVAPSLATPRELCPGRAARAVGRLCSRRRVLSARRLAIDDLVDERVEQDAADADGCGASSAASSAMAGSGSGMQSPRAVASPKMSLERRMYPCITPIKQKVRRRLCHEEMDLRQFLIQPNHSEIRNISVFFMLVRLIMALHFSAT